MPISTMVREIHFLSLPQPSKQKSNYPERMSANHGNTSMMKSSVQVLHSYRQKYCGVSRSTKW
jgi:hypothetical protein